MHSRVYASIDASGADDPGTGSLARFGIAGPRAANRTVTMTTADRIVVDGDVDENSRLTGTTTTTTTSEDLPRERDTTARLWTAVCVRRFKIQTTTTTTTTSMSMSIALP